MDELDLEPSAGEQVRTGRSKDSSQMLIRCTGKLLKEMGEKGAVIAEDGPMGSWFANLLYLDRRKCVLFTHSRTLFSLVVPGLRKRDIQDLPSLLVTNLKIILRAEGLDALGETNLDLQPEAFLIARTNNRSTLASMNDLAYQARVSVKFTGGYPDWDTVTLSHRLNHIPLGALNYRYAIEVFRDWVTGEASGRPGGEKGAVGQDDFSSGGGREPVSQASFSGPARRFWEGVDPRHRIRVLNNVWCGQCRRSSSIQLLDGRMERGDLVLMGRCTACGGEVARVVESA